MHVEYPGEFFSDNHALLNSHDGYDEEGGLGLLDVVLYSGETGEPVEMEHEYEVDDKDDEESQSVGESVVLTLSEH